MHQGRWKEGNPAWGRLSLGSERHKGQGEDADGWGGVGGGETREAGKSPRKVRKRCRVESAPGSEEAVQGGECSESPGGDQRRRLGLPSLVASDPNLLTMMEKTKATMLMGYAGQKHETMVSHR